MKWVNNWICPEPDGFGECGDELSCVDAILICLGVAVLVLGMAALVVMAWSMA